ncbi:MAG: peptidyl-tRNA hydrolase [Candidatus Nanohalarchaeota archaeon]|nr:MAG: peptidyl-tRNA hydrolase [Candidatus Nanohaloarchaeota archaeon]
MKQVLIVRTDIKMGKGKIAAQCAHASISAYEKTPFAKKNLWKISGQKKIVLKADSEKELRDIEKTAQMKNIKTALIRDAGHTQVEPNTVTALGIGPDEDGKIDEIVRKLKLL